MTACDRFEREMLLRLVGGDAVDEAHIEECLPCAQARSQYERLLDILPDALEMVGAEREPDEEPRREGALRIAEASKRRPHRDLIGKTIGGRYLVRSVLGEGGMGAVFEAENTAHGGSVAVKVLHPAQARKRVAVRRFQQEARSVGAIGHPNICAVYDLGTLDDGSPYFVMDRLVGETLADRIRSEGALPFEDVIEVVSQILSGLVAAHERGIVHRDIKPENIFLTRCGGSLTEIDAAPPLAKLLDFGVCKLLGPAQDDEDDELDLTRTETVMGTPFYMSPEQARGDRSLDARVDLYACGVVMYEALTGRRPFSAANHNALLLQILTTNPRPARELRPALPQGFDEVLDKALARSRDARFQSAAAFQRALESLRDRPGSGERARVEPARRPVEPSRPPSSANVVGSADTDEHETIQHPSPSRLPRQVRDR